MKSLPRYPGQLDWLKRLFEECHQAFLSDRPVDKALGSAFRRFPNLGSKDRKFYGTAIFGLYRYWGWLQGTVSPDPLLGLYLAYLLEEEQPSLLWSEALGLPPAPDLPPRGLPAKLVWIRSFVPQARLEDLTPDFLPPLGLSTLEALSQRPPTWVRQAGNGRFASALGQIKHHRHPHLISAIALEQPLDLQPYLGEVEVQDLSSQAVGAVCAAQPGQSWLDLCAGSGGKALHLWQQMKAKGRLVLTETRESALAEARERFGPVKGVEFRWLATDHNLNLGGDFDGVLVDVPCSGSGTWGRAPWLRWQLTPRVLAELAPLQAALLEQGASQVKPGGVLVYATCSLLAVENQGVTQAFLARHPEFSLAPFADPLTGKTTPGERLVLPEEEDSNGMYFCRMLRVG